MKARTLAYVSLQATDPGQAAHAHVREIILGLERRGWHVSLLQPNYKNGNAGALRRLWQTSRLQIAALRRLGTADALYVRSHFLTWPLVELASMRRSTPVVLELNGLTADAVAAWPSLRSVSRVLDCVLRRQLRRAAGVVVVTPQLGTYVKRVAPGVPVEVISNGANIEIFHPGIADAGGTRPYVVFFGALSPWQGVSTILAAASSPEWPNGVRLKIAGDGIARHEVEAAAVENPDVVDYLGTVPYGEMAALVGSALASLIIKEGDFQAGGLAPLKLYESVACGVPVIVSEQPFMSGFVRDLDCGLVVAQQDPAAVCDAVAKVHQEAERYLAKGRRAAVHVAQEHSWDARAEQTGRFLDRLLS